MENGSTLQPSGIKVQSVFLPLLPQSPGCSALLCSVPQTVALIDSTPPSSGLLLPPSSEHVQPESLRPSCVTLVTESLLAATAVAPMPRALAGDSQEQLADSLMYRDD